MSPFASTCAAVKQAGTGLKTKLDKKRETGGLREIHTQPWTMRLEMILDTLTRIHIPTWPRAATDSHHRDSVMFLCTPNTKDQGETRIGFGEVWRRAVPESQG